MLLKEFFFRGFPFHTERSQVSVSNWAPSRLWGYEPLKCKCRVYPQTVSFGSLNAER